MTITLFGGLTLPKKIRRLFKRPGIEPHLYLFGANGQPVQGFQPGNYFDSAGTTLASVDSSVGLVLDAAGSVGAELVGPLDELEWIPSGTGPAAVVDGRLEITSDGAASGYWDTAFCSIPTTVGRRYKVSIGDADPNGTGRSVYSSCVTGQDHARSTRGEISYQFVASGSTTNLFVGFLGDSLPQNGEKCYFGNISVREVTGIHATQSTPGFKPTLRKGIVNLLTYSRDFTSGNWTKSNGSIFTSNQTAAPDGSITAGKQLATAGGGSALIQSISKTSGVTYTSAYIVKSGNVNRVVVGQQYGGASYSDTIFDLSTQTVVSLGGGSPSVSYEALGGGWYLIATAVQATSSGSFGNYVGPVGNVQTTNTAAPGDYIYPYAVGCFAGTLTAAQILAAGGIPLTTTAPASSVAGPNHLEFKAANSTVLQLPSPAFQMADDHCVVVAATYAGGTVTNNVIYSPAADSTASSIKRIGQIAYDATLSRIQGSWYDGTNYDELYFAWPSGSPFVAVTRKVGSTLELWVNGVLRMTKTATATAFTANCGSIGGYPTGGAASYFNGVLHYADAIKGTTTVADVLLQSKLGASLAGIQL